MRITVRHVTRAWIVLVVLTLLSMTASHSVAGSIAGSGLALTAAVAKGRWMLMDFLKLRHVPSGWRTLLSSWLVLIAVSAWIAAAIPLLHG